MLHVYERDPDATVIVMPTDHAIANEERFIQAVNESLEVVRDADDVIALIAAEPSGSDMDYGWVVPGPSDGRWCTVARFREKPDNEEEARLRAEGGLINTLVMTARAATFERAFAHRAPGCHEELSTTMHDQATLALAFERLQPSSFSRDVLEHIPDRLRVVRLHRDAGWSDIGTPERLAQVIWPPDRPIVTMSAEEAG